MNTRMTLEERVRALEDEIARMKRENEDTLNNIGMGNLDSGLVNNINSLNKIVRKTVNTSTDYIQQYTVDMGVPVVDIISATWYSTGGAKRESSASISPSDNTKVVVTRGSSYVAHEEGVITVVAVAQ